MRDVMGDFVSAKPPIFGNERKQVVISHHLYRGIPDPRRGLNSQSREGRGIREEGEFWSTPRDNSSILSGLIGAGSAAKLPAKMDAREGSCGRSILAGIWELRRTA